MTHKERKKIARELAKYEIVIQAGHDEFAKRAAEEEVMRITLKIKNFDDMEAIDELVPKMIKDIIENGP